MKFNFWHFTHQIKLFFAEKGNRKNFGFENAMEREIGKILSSSLISNFREDNTEALVISKRFKLPWDDRTDINFKVPIRMYF